VIVVHQEEMVSKVQPVAQEVLDNLELLELQDCGEIVGHKVHLGARDLQV